VNPRAAAVLMAVCLLSPLCADDWPTASHDALRSGTAEGAGPSAAEIEWAVELGASVDGSPIVVGDRIYVGNSAGRFFCVQKDGGSVAWSYATGGAIVGAAAVGQERVYVGSADGFVYCLEAAGGSLLWRHRTEGPVLGCLALLEESLVFGSTDGTLRAVDLETGRTLWRVDRGAPLSAPPAVREGTMYCGDERGNVFALRAADGTEVWAARLAGAVVGAPTIAGDTLLVPLMSGSALQPPETEFLTAWNPADGTKLWSAEKPSAESVMGSPVVVNDTVWCLMVGGYTSSGVLRGFNLASGAKTVEQKLGVLVADAALAVAGNVIYLAGENGLVYFLDAATGAPHRPVQLGGAAFSSPAIADGRLYVGAQDGKLYCIK